MAATTNIAIPPWKAEILQKRNNKMKVESIPLWKKELLKRLKDKAQAAKLKMAAEVKKSDDKLILDEPLLKVSENIFVRQELERKMSANQLVNNHVKPSINHHIIKANNIVIIENSDPITEISSKQLNNQHHEVELPSVGIVSRLKGRFAQDDNKISSFALPNTRRLSSRSRSTDDILSLDDDAEKIPSPVSPTGPFSSICDKHPPFNRRFNRAVSTDSIESKGFYITPSTNLNIESSTKMPTSPTKNSPHFSPGSPMTSYFDDDKIDMTSLHASGTSKFVLSSNQKLGSHSDSFKTRPKLSDRTQEFTKSTLTLHASGNENEKNPNVPDEAQLVPETLTINLPTFPIATNDQNKVTKEKSVKVKNSETKSSERNRTTNKADLAENQHTRPEKAPDLITNKENIPIIPRRKTTSVSTSYQSSNKTVNNKEPCINNSEISSDKGGQIIELGRVSMDPSQLKSKAAIAANEIMKDSRTIMIVPRSSKQNSVPTGFNFASEKNSTEPSNKQQVKKNLPLKSLGSDQKAVKKSSPPSNLLPAEKDTVLNSRCKDHEDKLPTSSIDDVIAASSVVARSQNLTNTEKTTNVEAHVNKTISKPSEKYSNNSKPTFAINSSSRVGGKNFVINSSKRVVDTNRSAESDAAVKANFGGAKLNKTPGKRGTFVIVPKRPQSQSSVQPQTSTATKTKPSSGTLVIVPKAQIENNSTSSNTDTEENSTVKGKRKITVDQIVVIGGYVKLDHSSLSKPNKIRKQNRVKFEESRLESIYQYPSEASLLKEDHENQLNQRMSSLASLPGSGKESHLEKYTPKYLLSLKQNHEEEDDVQSSQETPSIVQNDRPASSDIAVPLAEKDAVTFSNSTSSSDLLF